MKSPLSCTLLFLSAVCFLQAGDDPSDLDRMQGSWEVLALTEKGKEVPKNELEALVVVVAKDVFTTFEKDKVLVKYRIKLDSTKKPKEVDFTHLEGESKDKTEPGIFTFEKETLKIVLDEDKKGRPTVFEGKETLSYSVIVLKKKAK